MIGRMRFGSTTGSKDERFIEYLDNFGFQDWSRDSDWFDQAIFEQLLF